jgi:hypothetical protein
MVLFMGGGRVNYRKLYKGFLKGSPTVSPLRVRPFHPSESDRFTPNNFVRARIAWVSESDRFTRITG